MIAIARGFYFDRKPRILVAGQGQGAIEAWMKKLGSIRKKQALFKLSKKLKHGYLILIYSRQLS
ncbi:hypothetical protein ASF12_09040 [Paenibacillus sp. Leaf72]|nr:hypothetical protein ASF12_09040 [Paenibacillus sp. Leaf72]